MHRLIPSILTTPHGEIGLFDQGVRPSGVHTWDVARPVPEGWEAIGTVNTTEGGYSAGGGWFKTAPVPSVTDAAATLARLCREYDDQHGYPAPLASVPAEDVGLGGRVYASAGEGR